MNDKSDTAARAPMRKRGIERFEHLLDVTAELVGEHPEDDVTLAQIADRAGVPLASIYHFFPNRNAALVALAQRYHRQFYDMAMSDGSEKLLGWQDVIRFRTRGSAAFLNSEPAALRLFMGAGVSAEVRNADIAGNAAIAQKRASYMRSVFKMSDIGDLEKRIAISLAIIDGIWALSYSYHRTITEEYIEEACRTAIAYLRCYLPEYLQPLVD